jgi:hypothetical protein
MQMLWEMIYLHSFHRWFSYAVEYVSTIITIIVSNSDVQDRLRCHKRDFYISVLALQSIANMFVVQN